MCYLKVFNLQIFWDFPAVFLLSIFRLIPLWSESKHCMISLPLNLLRFVLWHRIKHSLGECSYELEKNIYDVVVG